MTSLVAPTIFLCNCRKPKRKGNSPVKKHRSGSREDGLDGHRHSKNRAIVGDADEEPDLRLRLDRRSQRKGTGTWKRGRERSEDMRQVSSRKHREDRELDHVAEHNDGQVLKRERREKGHAGSSKDRHREAEHLDPPRGRDKMHKSDRRSRRESRRKPHWEGMDGDGNGDNEGRRSAYEEDGSCTAARASVFSRLGTDVTTGPKLSSFAENEDLGDDDEMHILQGGTGKKGKPGLSNVLFQRSVDAATAEVTGGPRRLPDRALGVSSRKRLPDTALEPTRALGNKRALDREKEDTPNVIHRLRMPDRALGDISGGSSRGNKRLR